MRRRKHSRGLTRIEVLIMMAVLTAIAAMLAPAIQLSRGKARWGWCANNLTRLGLGCHGYEEVHRKLPPSSQVTRNVDGTIAAVDGWSWQVLVLPYMDQQDKSSEYQQLYNTLDVASGRPLIEPVGAKGTPHADALATRLPWLLCPNFRGSPYADATEKAAVTTYKAMGATHIESLSVASPHPLTPKYNPVGTRQGRPVHPDGVCSPGRWLHFADITKGTSNTVFAVESVEQRFSRWTVGAEATLVGVPPIVEFEKNEDYWAPKGLSKLARDGEGTVDPVYLTYKTYLNWDCEKSPYDGVDGTIAGKFGPSSHHASGVNHLFADASVRTVSRDIDVTVYMNLIKHEDWRIQQ
jgi:hypothetical protein